MNKKDEALKLARDWIKANGRYDKAASILTVIELALAEQPAQQEPYGQVTVVRRPGCVDQHWFYRWPEPPYLDNAAECHAVYTSQQPSKPWVGLTDEEIKAMYIEKNWYEMAHAFTWGAAEVVARAIEAKLREKNS